MPVYVSLLRGVNVGGHRKIKMEELRALYGEMKLRDAQSYVQSGNVVFRTEETDAAAIEKRIRSGIEKKFSLRTEVMVRTAAELEKVTAKNPFAKRKNAEPGKLLVTFLAGAPDKAAKEAIEALNGGPEELVLLGEELYVYFPNGVSGSKIPWAKIEKATGVAGTGRNWNSVSKLCEMCKTLGRAE